MPRDQTLPRLPYTVKEVAEMYGVSGNYIYREIREGRLRARHKRGETKAWYVTDEDLREWVESGMWE